MKKLLLVGAGIYFGLFGLGYGLQSLSDKPAVKGITVSATPTETPTNTPTNIPTFTPSPTQITPAPSPTIFQPISTSTNQSGLDNDNYYINSQGQEIHSPANTFNGDIPIGATARCGDGTYSFSQSRRGTCSHHGGVAEWL